MMSSRETEDTIERLRDCAAQLNVSLRIVGQQLAGSAQYDEPIDHIWKALVHVSKAHRALANIDLGHPDGH